MTGAPGAARARGDAPVVDASGVTYAYAGASSHAVDGVAVAVGPGELLGIVGPNGSGKTTLLRLLAGLVRPSHGDVRLLGRGLGAWDRRSLARTVGVVSQREEPAFPIRVEQSVLFGRYPHLGALAAVTAGDRGTVEQAMERCDILHLRDRWVNTLSGGEWQRVRLARALAQQPRVLMLDEATANLDIRHEMEVFELVAGLVREERLAGIVVTHHVNLAARFVDRIMVMSGGRSRTSGPPAEVLTKDVLEDVFEWPVEVTSWDGAPQFVPVRRGVVGRRERPGG